MSNVIAHKSPYKGLQPYTERDRNFFFGRERDQEVITSNLFGSSLTVFYGASGVGKSSVLLAGVVPILRETSRVAVAVFREWQDTSFETALKLKVLEAIGSKHAIDIKLELDEFLLACMRAFRGSLFIILDQFEEYFLYHPLSPQAEEFDAAFARAINRREIGANFLLAMRDDGLSRLDRFQKRIPNLMNNMLRLEHLGRESAERAIRNPLARYNQQLTNGQLQVQIDDDLVEVLLDDLRTGRVTHDLTGQGKVSKEVRADETARIETPFLQVVLTRLWDEEHQQAALTGKRNVTLRVETYEGLGRATSIVRTHLDKTMDTDRLLPHRDTAAALFHFLVTPTGMKIAHTVDDLISYVKLPRAQVERTLNELSEPDVRILRPIAPAAGQKQLLRYEIFHDVLAPAILDWRSRVVTEQEKALAKAEAEKNLAEQRKAEEQRALAHRLEQANALAEAERQRAEAETQRAEIEGLRATEQSVAAGRLRKLVAGLVAAFLAVAGLTVFAFVSWQHANAQSERANAQAALAEELRTQAQGETKRANDQAALASAREKEATDARAATLVALKKAEDERRRAEEQASIADRERKRAEQLQAYAEKQRVLAVKAADEATAARHNEALYREALALSRRISTREQAIPKLGTVIDFFRAKDDQAALMATLLSKGEVHAELDYGANATAADEAFSQALNLAANDRERAITRARIADVYRELPPWLSSRPREKALALYEEAFKEFGEVNDRPSQAGVKVAMGLALGDQAAASSPTEGNAQFLLAVAHIELGLDIYKELKDERNVALALWNAGEVALKGPTPEIRQMAYNYFTRALEAYRGVGDKKGEAAVLRRLVYVDQSMQRFDKALAGYLEIVKVYDEINDPVLEAAAIDELGFAFADQYANPMAPPAQKQALADQAPTVIALMKRAAASPAFANNPIRRATLLTSLGRIYEERQEFAAAIGAYEEGLKEYKLAPGSAPPQVYVLEALTRVSRSMKDAQEVKRYLQETAQLVPELQVPSQKLNSSILLGSNALDANDDKLALDAFKIALETSREIGQPIYTPVSLASTLHRVGSEYSRRGRLEDAMGYFTEALELFRKENQFYGQTIIYTSIAESYTARKEHLKAIEYYQRALRLNEQWKYNIGRGQALRAISASYRAMGNNAEAENYQRQAEALGPAGPSVPVPLPPPPQ